METNIPKCFYRVSAKALILNETRDKFLIAEEPSGKWELLGGGLDWGTTPQEDIPREILEETGLPVTSVSKHPIYFFTKHDPSKPYWYANVIYEVTVAHLYFTPSDECIALEFVTKDTVGERTICQVTK